MGIDLNKLEEFFNSAEGKEVIECDKFKQELKEKRFKKFEDYIKTHDFDKLMYRIILEHNDEWHESCYDKGMMPYPNNKLTFILNYIEDKSTPLTDYVGDEECDFSSITFEFKNYYFQTIYGQGSITRIYNKFDNRLLLQI